MSLLPDSSTQIDMVWIPGGTFAMGSDAHYPEEAPIHRVTVDRFWMDPTPVTNRQFREFVEATGYITFAEVAPRAEDYPGALPHMLKAGSLVFRPPTGKVDLRDWSQWWEFRFGANWRHPYGRGTWIKGLDDHPAVHVAYRDAEATPSGPARNCPRRPSGSLRRAAASRVRSSLGAMSSRPAGSTWPTPGKATSRTRT